MHPRLQEVQFLDSKGKPLPARQREVVGEAFSAWFEEKILPQLEGTSGPIFGHLRIISRYIGEGTRFSVRLIAHRDILDEWMDGTFDLDLETGRSTGGTARTRWDDYRSRWLFARVRDGVQGMASGSSQSVHCGICGGPAVEAAGEIWNLRCPAGCFEGVFIVSTRAGSTPVVLGHSIILHAAKPGFTPLRPNPIPWDRYAALLRPLNPLRVRHSSADEVMDWVWSQPRRQFGAPEDFEDAQEDFLFLVSRAFQPFVRTGLATPFSGHPDFGVEAQEAWWRKLSWKGSSKQLPGLGSPGPLVIDFGYRSEAGHWTDGLPVLKMLECIEQPDDRWIPALRELAPVVSALPIVLDGAALGESGRGGFAVLLKADECWLGTDDVPTRDHVTRLLRKAGLIEESKG